MSLALILVFLSCPNHASKQFYTTNRGDVEGDGDEITLSDLYRLMLEQHAATSQTFNTLGEKVTQLDEKVTQLDEKVTQLGEKVAQINATMIAGFQATHSIGASRAALLNASSSVYSCGNSTLSVYSTTHNVFFKGKVFGVSVKHQPCDPNPDWLYCAKYDVAFIRNCPATPKAINITVDVPLRTGDVASTFGYAIDDGEPKGRYWVGSLAGTLGNLSPRNNVSGLLFKEQYVFQSVMQIPGMSGGATLNKCGYTGMAQATYSVDQKSTSAVVISADQIKECFHSIDNELLTNFQNCPNIVVEEVPFSYVSC